MGKATRDRLLSASRATHREPVPLQLCSSYTRGSLGSLPFGYSPAHPQPLPVTYLRFGSASLPGSLCWPHTSKNQLALPSGRA